MAGQPFVFDGILEGLALPSDIDYQLIEDIKLFIPKMSSDTQPNFDTTIHFFEAINKRRDQKRSFDQSFSDFEEKLQGILLKYKKFDLKLEKNSTIKLTKHDETAAKKLKVYCLTKHIETNLSK